MRKQKSSSLWRVANFRPVSSPELLSTKRDSSQMSLNKCISSPSPTGNYCLTTVAFSRSKCRLQTPISSLLKTRTQGLLLISTRGTQKNCYFTRSPRVGCDTESNTCSLSAHVQMIIGIRQESPEQDLDCIPSMSALKVDDFRFRRTSRDVTEM